MQVVHTKHYDGVVIPIEVDLTDLQAGPDDLLDRKRSTMSGMARAAMMWGIIAFLWGMAMTAAAAYAPPH